MEKLGCNGFDRRGSGYVTSAIPFLRDLSLSHQKILVECLVSSTQFCRSHVSFFDSAELHTARQLACKRVRERFRVP